MGRNNRIAVGDRRKRHRDKLRADGLCQRCRKALDRDGARCRACNDYLTERARERRHSMRISNDGA